MKRASFSIAAMLVVALVAIQARAEEPPSVLKAPQPARDAAAVDAQDEAPANTQRRATPPAKRQAAPRQPQQPRQPAKAADEGVHEQLPPPAPDARVYGQDGRPLYREPGYYYGGRYYPEPYYGPGYYPPRYYYPRTYYRGPLGIIDVYDGGVNVGPLHIGW